MNRTNNDSAFWAPWPWGPVKITFHALWAWGPKIPRLNVMTPMSNYSLSGAMTMRDRTVIPHPTQTSLRLPERYSPGIKLFLFRGLKFNDWSQRWFVRWTRITISCKRSYYILIKSSNAVLCDALYRVYECAFTVASLGGSGFIHKNPTGDPKAPDYWQIDITQIISIIFTNMMYGLYTEARREDGGNTLILCFIFETVRNSAYKSSSWMLY